MFSILGLLGLVGSAIYQADATRSTQPTSSGLKTESNTTDIKPYLTSNNPDLHQPIKTGDALFPQSRGLAGTTIDGSLQQDKQGNLIISINTKDLFDYFLQAEDELGDNQDRARQKLVSRFNQYAEQQLPTAAASQAKELFMNYLAYLDDLKNIDGEEQWKSTTSLIKATTATNWREKIVPVLESYTAAQDNMRDQYFNSHAKQGLFGTEDRELYTTLYATKHAETTPSKTLNQRFSYYQQNLEPTQTTANINNEIHNDSNSYDVREQLFGSDAARRLESLDKKRALWMQRIENFNTSRSAILNSASNQEAVEMLEADLLMASFQQHEIPRVRALIRLSEIPQNAFY